MIRRRILLVTCLFGAIALALYGLYRWPLEYRSRRSEDVSGRKTHEVRFTFAKDPGRLDRVLGTADYLSCVLLFLAGPFFRYRKKPRPETTERLPDWEVLDMVCVIPSIIGALVMTLVSIGAVLSLFG